MRINIHVCNYIYIYIMYVYIPSKKGVRESPCAAEEKVCVNMESPGTLSLVCVEPSPQKSKALLHQDWFQKDSTKAPSTTKIPHMLSKDGRQICNMTIAADSRRDLCAWRCLGCCHGKLVRASPATSQRTRKRSDGRVGSLITCQDINQIQSVIKHQAHHSSFIAHDA